MSAFTAIAGWLTKEESRYAEDFVEEEDSFLILPNRSEQVENVEAALANAGDEAGTPVASSMPPNGLSTSLQIATSPSEPVDSGSEEKDFSLAEHRPSLDSVSVEQPSPLPRASRYPGQMVDPRTDGTETPSLISAISSVHSSENSLDETNMMLSQLNLQSCKDKMAEMTASATKNLEAYKELQLSISSLREEHQKKYEECGETIRTLRSENQSLTNELTQAKLQVEEHTTKNENNLIEIEKLEVLIAANEININQLKKQLEELLNKLQEATKQNNELKELLNQQELRMQGGKQSEVDMCSILEERNVLNEAWEASKITVAQLKEMRLKQEETITQMARELKETRVINKNLNEYTVEKKAVIVRLELDLREVRSINEQLKEALTKEADIVKLKSALAEATAMNDRLRDYGLKKDENVEKLMLALDEAGNRLRQFQGIVAEKDADINNLQTRMAALTSENEQKEIWKQQMEEFKSNFEDERRDRMAMRERLEIVTDELNKANEQLEKKTADLESLHQTHLRLANEHVNRQPTQTNGSDSRPNSLPHAVTTLTQKISNIFQSIVPSQLWDEDAHVGRGNTPSSEENNGATVTTAGIGSQPSPAPTTLGPQNSPPCPLCSKTFKSVALLQRHASNCGIETAAATRTDPFVFP